MDANTVLHSIWTAQRILGKREYQEDCYAVLENKEIIYNGDRYPIDSKVEFPAHQSLYILVDGMGGMKNGALAAGTVLESFIENYLNNLIIGKSVPENLLSSLQRANDEIQNLVTANNEYDGMGCTLVAVLFDCMKKTIQWISVGDSPFWLMRDRKITQLNEKHTWGEFAKAQKAMGKEFDEQYFTKIANALCSAVDGNEIEHIDQPQNPYPVQAGDMFLLASDGMETLSIAELERIITSEIDMVDGVHSVSNAFALLNSCRENLFAAIDKAARKKQDNTTLIFSAFLGNNG